MWDLWRVPVESHVCTTEFWPHTQLSSTSCVTLLWTGTVLLLGSPGVHPAPTSAPIKKQQRHRVSQSPRDHADLSMTNICPDRCWKCSDQPGSWPWLPSQSSRHPSPICVFLFFLACKWGTYKKQKVTLHHSVLPSDFLIWAKVRPTAPPRLRVSP